MAIAVEVPKLGNTVEECLIAKWCKRKGERVSIGDVVAEIETDKATFEVTAPVDGTLLETFFDEGALVPVFTNLFVLGEPGESADAFRPQGAAHPVAATATDAVAAAPAAPKAERETVRPVLPDLSARGRGGLPANTASIRRRSPVPVLAAGFWKRTCASCIIPRREFPLWRRSKSRRAWRLAARVRARPAWSSPAIWFRRRLVYLASARRSRGACGSL